MILAIRLIFILGCTLFGYLAQKKIKIIKKNN